MKLKSSAMLIAIVLAILISGAVTTISYFVVANKLNADLLLMQKKAYYSAYGLLERALGETGREIDYDKIVALSGRRYSESSESRDSMQVTDAYLKINPISIGETQGGSKVGPAGDLSPKLFGGINLVYYINANDEVDFFWSRLKANNKDNEFVAKIQFELKKNSEVIFDETFGTDGQYHKNLKGCSGKSGEFCVLTIRLESESRTRLNKEDYVNFAINPSSNYGNSTNVSLVATSKITPHDGLEVEKKLIARFSIIDGKLINIMGYDCDKCEK